MQEIKNGIDRTHLERYSLLCDKKVKIENAENFYSVSLPIIKKQSL